MVGDIDATSKWLSDDRVEKFDNIGTGVTSSVITFPLGMTGNFHISLTIYGTSAVLASPTLSLVGCSFLDLFNGNTEHVMHDTGYTSPTLVLIFYIEILDPDVQASVTFSAGTYPLLCVGGDLMIIKLPLEAKV